jgi:putative ABC transport system permease protein
VGGLTSLAWRGLRARPGRTLLSIVGIALGVGVLFASLATDAGIEASIDRTVRDLVGQADLRVSAFQDERLSPETVAAIEAAPGVVVAAPVLEKRTFLEQDADSVDATNPPVTIIAVDPAREARVRDLGVIRGTPLSGPEAFGVVITETLAADVGLDVGSQVRVTVGPGSGPTSLDVVGVLPGDGPFVGSGGRTIMIPLTTAQRLFQDDGVSRVDILVGEGATAGEVADALEVALTTEPYVLSSPQELGASLRSSTADFRSTTALIAAVALFVGAFLIFNTLSMTVTERVRELGLLRAAGATAAQIRRFVLTQASLLGIAGVVAGLAIGAALSEVMGGYVRAVGSIPFEGADVGPGAASVALAIGLFVVLAASLEPARRAGAISPVEALKSRLEPMAARRARLRWLVGVFGAVGIAGLFVWPRDAGGVGLVRALAVYLVLLAVTLLSPFILGSISRVAGIPFAAVLRLEERLARAARARDRSRSAVTVGALTAGLGMGVAIGGVAGQSRSAAADWLAEVIPGDELLTSIDPLDLADAAGYIEDIEAIDGVASVSPIATFEVAHEGVRIDAAAVVGADLLADGRLVMAAGDRGAALGELDDGGATIVPRVLAQRLGLGVGDRLTLALGNARVLELRVAGIATRTLPGRSGETILVGWDDATEALGVQGADALAVRYVPGREADARPNVDELADQYTFQPTSLAQVATAVDSALGRVFGLFDALALVAVVVAALGIVNTLTMNVLERVREIGVLRAAGMTIGQVRRTVVVEAGILGVIGSALGIVTGLLVGALMITLGGAPPTTRLELPWASIALAAGLGVGLSMLAAWYPARLASRLAIVRAVQHE